MESNFTERIGLFALMAMLGVGLVLAVDAHHGGQLARWILYAFIQ